MSTRQGRYGKQAGKETDGERGPVPAVARYDVTRPARPDRPGPTGRPARVPQL